MPDQPCITLLPSTSVASGCFKCHKPSSLNLLLTSFAHLCLQPGVCGSCCYSDEISTNLTDSHKHKIHSQIHKKPQCKYKSYHIDRTHTGKISYDRKFKIMLQFGSIPSRSTVAFSGLTWYCDFSNVLKWLWWSATIKETSASLVFTKLHHTWEHF